MIHASVFSGIGGFDLAAEWMGWSNAFYCEHNAICRRVLQYYWPDSACFIDIKQSIFKKYANKINVLSGGFPCQPFSCAGKRRGTNDERYLWPEMRRSYNEIRPDWVVCENVSGLVTMEDPQDISKDLYHRVEGGQCLRLQEIDDYEALYVRQSKMLLETICEDFERDGYNVQPFIIPAASIEAPHRRDRLWLVAHSDHDGRDRSKDGQGYKKRDDGDKAGTNATVQSKGCGSQANVADSHGSRLQRGEQQRTFEKRQRSSRSIAQSFEVPTWSEWPVESPVCCGDDGFPGQLDGITVPKLRKESIKAYGNAIVPQIAFEIFRTIQAVEDEFRGN